MPAILFAYTATLAAGTSLFGWNLAELNALQKAIQEDLGLGATQFGLASSILAVGGLVGSGIATPGVNVLGRKRILIGTATGFGLAGILKASAGNATVLILGRFLGGVAAGSAAVVVPIYINELAPPDSKGAYGALTQISINFGILSSQVLGIFMERNGLWRFLLLTGGMIGFVQAVALPFLPESPASLAAAGKLEQARRELAKIRGTPDVEEELAGYMGQSGGQSDTTDDTQTVSGQDPVLAAEAGQSGRTGNTNLGNENTPLLQATSTPGADNEIGLVAFATKREHRLGLMIVAGVMLAQQLTGINAVVFYGVSILQVLLPNSARYLNAGISGVNLFVTLGASLLFDRVSHKILLLASMLFMAISAGLLAISIFAGLATLSAIATLLFVVSFSMGLGPLPWMVASRRIEPVAVGAAQSIALISNWMGTFFVSFLVPMLAHSAGMYAIFIVFTALSLIFLVWGIFFL